jgi:hypothetical protein
VSFNDSEGKPFVFQMGGHDWATAMTALGFAAEMQAQGFADLGVAVTSAAQRDALLKTLDTLFATASRDLWVARMTLSPGVEQGIDGNALLSAIRYEVEKLRCSSCGAVCNAPLPMDASPEK